MGFVYFGPIEHPSMRPRPKQKTANTLHEKDFRPDLDAFQAPGAGIIVYLPRRIESGQRGQARH